MAVVHMKGGSATARASKGCLAAARPLQMIWTRSHLAGGRVLYLPTHQI